MHCLYLLLLLIVCIANRGHLDKQWLITTIYIYTTILIYHYYYYYLEM